MEAGVVAARGIAHINLEALRENFAVARGLSPGLACIAVVKADAYGHGAVAISRALVEAGADQLAVVTVAEGVELRDAGITRPILMLGGLHSDSETQEACAHGLTPTLHHPEGLARIRAAARSRNRPWPIHVKVDTGMRRMGIATSDAAALLADVAQSPELELEGLYTHLACAEDPDPAFSLAQLAEFRGVLKQARDRGLDPPLIHFANSAGLLAGESLAKGLPEATACRPGLMLYGALPCPREGVGLRAVMSLRARVVNLRQLSPGDTVGYGATYRATLPTRVATIPLGYADGVPCALANRGDVWLDGDRRPIVGRISMDYLTVDIGSANVALGDEGVLFGQAADGAFRDGIPVEEVAERAATIPYEILVRVGQRILRHSD